MQTHMDAYFARMQDILGEDIPSRIRFMLQDVIELRMDQVAGLLYIIIHNVIYFSIFLDVSSGTCTSRMRDTVD